MPTESIVINTSWEAPYLLRAVASFMNKEKGVQSGGALVINTQDFGSKVGDNPTVSQFTSIEYVTPIVKDNLSSSLSLLEAELGEELFQELTFSDKLFLLKAAGSVDFGKPIDLYRIAEDIRGYVD